MNKSNVASRYEKITNSYKRFNSLSVFYLLDLEKTGKKNVNAHTTRSRLIMLSTKFLK